jgi:tetratricopeptide (TPR) repeat protein
LPASLGSLRRFGDYELIEEIARGGMGVIYRARQVNLGREVAVKLMLHGALASAEEVDRFRAEAAAAASLKHPNIVAIHEVGEQDGQYYFSMDLIQGQDLATLTRDGPWPAHRAGEVMVRVAEAVQHAHEHGVLHRDLKPSNIILDAEGSPHVTDFGLARRFDQAATLTQTGQMLGTPGFMPPEQAGAGNAPLDRRADVYSLGAVLYYLLTGRPPFIGQSAPDVLRQVVAQEPVSPRLLNPAVPKDLETICLKCLSKEVEKRYPDTRDVAADLGRFLRHEPILARPINRVQRAARWARRNPSSARLVALVGLLLALLGLGAILSVQRLQRDRRTEARLRAEAETRLRTGERLINFLLGDLVDRLEPLGRLDLLEGAVSQVERFHSEVPLDRLTPESWRNRAQALFQFGEIRAAQGRFDESLAHYHAAIAAYQDLITRFPTNAQWQSELARAWNDLGNVLARQNDNSNAAVALARSLEDRERLRRANPTNTAWLSGYAPSAQDLAQLLRRQGRTEEAAALLNRAEEALRCWILIEPDASVARERLATVRGSVGQLLAAQNQLDLAALAYAGKVQLLRDLLREDPQHALRKADLMLGLSYVCELSLRQSNYFGAFSAGTEGVQLGSQLLQQDPGNREWQFVLVSLLVDCGEVERQLKRPEEALGHFRKAWELSEKQAEAALQYPEWKTNWLRALVAGQQVARELATNFPATGYSGHAEAHSQLAEALGAKMRAFPR